MTDISKEAVERLAKTADLFASAMKAFQHHTKKHNEDVRDTLRAQAAHITEQDAKIAKLVEALKRLERICVNRQPDKISDGVKIARDAIALASIGETND